MSTLNFDLKLLAYSDSDADANPLRRHVDWRRTMSKLQVSNPHSNEYDLAAGETRTIFSGVRSTSVDGTTEFDVALSPLDAARYRFSYTGGTNPVLRTDRNLTLTGIEVTFTANPNATVTVTLPGGSGSTFAGVVAGDTVFLPDTATGDSASVFNSLNTGFWQVLAVVSSRNLVLARLSGAIFEGTSETIEVTDNDQFQAYSAAGVQVGDSVEISAVFASVTQRSYEIVAVTSSWFEVVSTSPIPDEEGVIPGAAGIAFYRYTKNFLYIESDQEIVVRANGDSGSTQRLQPFESANPDRVGVYMKSGPVWSLDLVNRSTSEAHVLLVLSE